MKMVVAVSTSTPAPAIQRQGGSFVRMLASDFEALLKSDAEISGLFKKKASNRESWTVVVRAAFYQDKNSLDAVLHIQHIFSDDETEWAYLIHSFDVKGDVIIEDYARKKMRDFRNDESKSEHLPEVISFNIKAVNLLKKAIRDLAPLNRASGGRDKVEIKIVLSNLNHLVKITRA